MPKSPIKIFIKYIYIHTHTYKSFLATKFYKDFSDRLHEYLKMLID